jgi:hypothetical protein
MNRRSFLKLVSSIAGAAAVPAVPLFNLVEPHIIIPQDKTVLGAIREMAFYDINWDRVIVRLDAFNGVEQFLVDFVVTGQDLMESRKNYLTARTIAETTLREALMKRGWRATDMIALPVPLGYEPSHFRFLRA